MKIITSKKARELSQTELVEKRNEFKLELSKLRAAAAIGQSHNPGRLRMLRRSIARVESVLSEKETSKTKTKKK